MPGIVISDAQILELAHELEEILYSRGDAMHLQNEREVQRYIRYKDFDWDACFRGVPYGVLYRVVSVSVHQHVRGEERTDCPAADHPDDAPGGAKTQSAIDAMTALWPDGIRGVAVKDRNRKIADWCREHSRSIPSDRTIERVAADIAHP